MKTWTELVSQRYEGVADEYGPQSHAVWSAFEALGA